MLEQALKNRKKIVEAKDDVSLDDILKIIARYQITLCTRWSTAKNKTAFIAKMNTLTQAMILATQGDRVRSLQLYNLAKTSIK